MSWTRSPSNLPQRRGPRPRTTRSNPHTQLDQNAPEELQRALAARIFALDGVEERPSVISVPGARALWLREECGAGGQDAFLVGREFAHLHPLYDGSLHAALPPEVAASAIEAGWAEPHPLALRGVVPGTIVMLYGPRDLRELEVIGNLVAVSFEFARGRNGAGGKGE
jgi:phospholipase/carboxylesterase